MTREEMKAEVKLLNQKISAELRELARQIDAMAEKPEGFNFSEYLQMRATIERKIGDFYARHFSCKEVLKGIYGEEVL